MGISVDDDWWSERPYRDEEGNPMRRLDHPMEAMRDNAMAPASSYTGAAGAYVPTRSDDAAMTDPFKREKAAPSAPDFSDMPFARLQDYFRKTRIAPE